MNNLTVWIGVSFIPFDGYIVVSVHAFLVKVFSCILLYLKKKSIKCYLKKIKYIKEILLFTS